MQVQLHDVALRVGTLEHRASTSAPPQLPYTQSPLLPYSPPYQLPYGLPGYGGIPSLPSSGPLISEVLPTPSVEAAVVPTTGFAVSRPPQPRVPITQLAFPHSPSPIPSLSSIMNAPQVTAPPHEAPSSMTIPSAGAAGAAPATGVPRFHKLSFPMFDGKEDPLGWLNRCESFFRGQLTRVADKTWLASFHMTGPAQQWYVILQRDIGMPSWELFKQYCIQRFGPPLSTNHLADLARLPFTSTVEAYIEAFQARMAHAGRLKPLQQALLFTGGLPDHIRIDVELHEPQDLHRAMRLARAYERRTPAPLALPAPPAVRS